MDYHHHARLTVFGRESLCRDVLEGRLSLREAAAERGLSRQTVGKWVRRYRAQGVAGLSDRSSRPHRLRQVTPMQQVVRVEALRRQRWNGVRIAQTTGLSRATVSRILVRLGLNRMRDLEPPPLIQRYEHAAAGDLLHLDIKKLARIHQPGHRVTGNRDRRLQGASWEYVHVAIDDHSRIAFTQVYPDDSRTSATVFLHAALDYYRRLGIRFKAILTDNGGAYRSRAFTQVCRRLQLKHRFTRPYTPRTNGKAERFIQTAIHEWAYAHTYQDSSERQQQLKPWLHHYNWHRPHASLANKSPISRAPLPVNNLLRLHT